MILIYFVLDALDENWPFMKEWAVKYFRLIAIHKVSAVRVKM